MNVYKVKDFYIGYRPEQVHFGAGDNSEYFNTHGQILTKEMLGSETHYKLRLAVDSEEPVEIMIKSEDWKQKVDDIVEISVPRESLCFFGEDENRIRPEDAKYEECMKQV